MMMASSDMNEYPAIGFQFGDDFAAVHTLIIHTIHTLSTIGDNGFSKQITCFGNTPKDEKVW